MLSLISSLAGPVESIIGKFVQDKDQKAALAHEIATLADKQANEQALAQIQVNTIEASHKSMFVAGWRPALGWVFALAMLMNFIIIPLVNFGLDLASIERQLDLIEMETMMPVLLGMLGLGGMRTAEKIKKVERNK
mgnify:CR=1 FL=1